MREVKIGKEYRHFKGGVYKVFTVSNPVGVDEPFYSCCEVEHTETREKFDLVCVRHSEGYSHYHDKSVDEGRLVIYSKDNEKFWARPEPMFLSPVDKEKYPDATQEFRLEEI